MEGEAKPHYCVCVYVCVERKMEERKIVQQGENRSWEEWLEKFIKSQRTQVGVSIMLTVWTVEPGNPLWSLKACLGHPIGRA